MIEFLVDSHCHLDMIADQDGNCLSSVISSARTVDVKVLQTICTRLDQIENIIKIAESFDGVFCSVGVHPCNVEESAASFPVESLHSVLLGYTDHKKVIGIGETGLDYYHNYSESIRANQIEYLLKHIEVAQVTKLPLIIHTRSAESDTGDILTREYNNSPFAGVMHCFTGSKALAKRALDIGFYISASGIITFKNALEIQELFKYIPMDRIIIETDSPYLAPVPYRGKTNKPSFVKYVADKLAELKGMDFHEIAHITSRNFFSLFQKASL